MIVFKCDFCNEIRDCKQKEIDRTEYDICSECWNALMAKLKDKGRPKASRDWLIVSPSVTLPDIGREAKPYPGQPPEIVAGSERAN